jgi:hypothetical protein
LLAEPLPDPLAFSARWCIMASRLMDVDTLCILGDIKQNKGMNTDVLSVTALVRLRTARTGLRNRDTGAQGEERCLRRSV